jgi:type IV secretory pathway TrbD component
LIRGLPLAALVGYQVFRFPLELFMHRAYVEGLRPVQMSYSGRNFDILTGISAGLLALALCRWNVPRFIVHAWNMAGFALLVNIVTIAVVSTPAFAWFGRDRLNVWVTYSPFVRLPAVMVTAGLMGHLLVWRKLRLERLAR